MWSVDYRMLPDHPFPSTGNDCVAGNRRLLQERRPDEVILGASSAGGNPLDSLKGDTLGGMSPPLTFAANQPHKIDRWFTVHVTNDVANLVNNGQTTCEKGSCS